MRFAALALVVIMQAAPDIKTVSRDSMSGFEEQRLAVAQSEDEWTRLWRLHAPEKPMPFVDFKTRTVVGVFLGTRSSAGYTVEIVRTKRDAKALVVEWSEGRPTADTVTAQVLTSPAHIVSIPRFAGDIRFEKVDR